MEQHKTKVSAEIFDEGGITKIRLTKSIIFIGNDGRKYIIPEGYVSDGASVPRFFWRILSPCIDGRTLPASIIHDFEYKHKIGTRAGADKDYYARLVADGYPRVKAAATYIGVRAGGSKHWGDEK